MLRSAEFEQSLYREGRLEAGDHLDQSTFHRLYLATPEGFKAELIEGVVIVPSPLRYDHGDVGSRLLAWLGVYRLATPGVGSLDNATVLLPPDSEPQPDGTLIIKPDRGGQTRLEDGYLTGAPELVVEIASSSVSYDLHSKYRLYEKVGVREYVVAVLGDKQVRWFVAEKGSFASMAADTNGIFRSRVFPGLWLDAAALWSDDDAKLLEAVQRGLASPEHGAFVDKLQSQRG
jgi:Uma2 family endonuclease